MMIKPHRGQPLWIAFLLHRISGLGLGSDGYLQVGISFFGVQSGKQSCPTTAEDQYIGFEGLVSHLNNPHQEAKCKQEG